MPHPPPLTGTSILRSDKSFPSEKIVKDVGKWVESVKELKSAAEKEGVPSPKTKRGEKLKNKSSTKPVKMKNLNSAMADPTFENPFNTLKDQYKNLKLPPGWIAGTSGNNIIFNRFRITSLNSVHKMTAGRGVLIAPDCSVHVFLNGTEIPETSWVPKKVETVEDVRKVIKDTDSFKICSKASKNHKSEQSKSGKLVSKKSNKQKKETK